MGKKSCIAPKNSTGVQELTTLTNHSYCLLMLCGVKPSEGKAYVRRYEGLWKRCTYKYVLYV